VKIGILFSAYNCAAYIDECLEPWLKLKKELNLILAATNGRYILSPEEPDDMKGSHSLLKLLGKNLDFLLHSCGENRWSEEQGRNYMLYYLLDQKVDLIWVIDCDEIYTEKDIYNILSYIKENPEPDCYKLFYKNYCIKHPYWIDDDFTKFSIYWTNRREGIKTFYFDCDIQYNNGDNLNSLSQNNIGFINKNTAFIDHYSWIQDDPRVKDKIHNQNIKYAGEQDAKCAYIVDAQDNLMISETFFKKRNMQLPHIHKSVVNSLHICDIIYNKIKNVIYFTNITNPDDYQVAIADSDNNTIYSCDANLCGDYYIAPSFDLRNVSFFNVIIKKFNTVLKHEELHVKFNNY
tara:strand:- start:13850 stop:14893 length:1044 start_codon:yes stop_codon:yes gene_type:complete